MIVARRANGGLEMVVETADTSWSMEWDLPDDTVRLWVPLTPHEAVDLPLGAIQLGRQSSHIWVTARVTGRRVSDGVSWGLEPQPRPLHELAALRIRAITEQAVDYLDYGNKHVVAGLQLIGVIDGLSDLRRMIVAKRSQPGAPK